ncbi:MAG: hypothetical protein LBS65_10370 [Desulfovibrio sp.]|jgi:hypothetical protein|nr:hypothetical protein [Desulfovibrio sp.]
MEKFTADLLLFAISLAGVSAIFAAYHLIHFLSLRREHGGNSAEAAAAFRKDFNLKKICLITLCLSCLLSSAWVTENLSRLIALLTCFFIIYRLLLAGVKFRR